MYLQINLRDNIVFLKDVLDLVAVTPMKTKANWKTQSTNDPQVHNSTIIDNSIETTTFTYKYLKFMNILCLFGWSDLNGLGI